MARLDDCLKCLMSIEICGGVAYSILGFDELHSSKKRLAEKKGSIVGVVFR